MTRIMIVATCTLWVLLICQAYCLEPAVSINGRGQIFITERLRVNQFGFRIADMMVDLLSPNLDDRYCANSWQQGLDDLKTASPNGEITHVQLRTFWKIPNISDQTTWNTPLLGAYDEPNGGQQAMVDNWKNWIFGSPTEPAYEPCVAKRIHNAGFKLEFCLSTAWTGNGTIADSIPVFNDRNESDYPSFNGELFLQNYMDNCLIPVTQFLASSPNFLSGDIFMLSFEMCYPYCDFAWSHNEKWTSIIQTVRDIFRAAGKSVPLTIDHNSWYNDFGLGYNAVKLLNADAPIDAETRGISGASYLKELDFISLSFWLELLREEDIPTTWNDTHIDTLVLPAWSNCPRWYKVGTGYNSVPGQWGRDFLADFGALSKVMNDTKILLNTGWENGHETLYYSGRLSGGSYDNEAQKVAWAGQVRAVRKQSWCAGQDFERYCEDKQSDPSLIDTSWRKSIAEAAIIQEIRAPAIRSADTNGDGKVDVYDAITLANAFGSQEGSDKWNEDCDLNGDLKVDVFDGLILARSF